MLDCDIDSIYDYFDFLLRRERYNFIGQILKNVNVRECHDDELLSYLTVTYPAKSKLKDRKNFYERVSLILDKDLLKGLE